MTTYLLDVNMLLALSDPRHVHHEPAHAWFAQVGSLSWATCPITENGFVRVASNPRYPNRPGNAAAILALLRQFCTLDGHHFWPADVRLQDFLPENAVVGHNQLTALYLLGLAIHHQGKLATLDQRIPAYLLDQGDGAMELVGV